jgi:transposase
MSKTTNKFSPEVRERAVRLVLATEGQHASRWQAVMSIAAKIGCTPQTLMSGSRRPRSTAAGARAFPARWPSE